ncbi:DUF1772 domain-containing protein [Kribbella italica]|uniref:Putative membrane protein n=1 Tax=Kribbella italica TaxID=1540520 RepID=A0A7W9MVU8_9ACTN|nr:anthrone oxygenase family protein [Kribbella italica]MBB5837363.1 putative membrane protein [Kribbella italica]
MTKTTNHWLTITAAVGTALTGGVFFDFSLVVMPAVRELPAEQGIAAMRALNRTAPGPFALIAFCTAVVCAVVVVQAAVRRDRTAGPWVAAATAAFLLAAVVITGAANIPISASIDALDPAAPDTAARWDDLFTQWLWWNHARLLACLAATAAFVVAMRPQPSPVVTYQR